MNHSDCDKVSVSECLILISSDITVMLLPLILTSVIPVVDVQFAKLSNFHTTSLKQNHLLSWLQNHVFVGQALAQPECLSGIPVFVNVIVHILSMVPFGSGSWTTSRYFYRYWPLQHSLCSFSSNLFTTFFLNPCFYIGGFNLVFWVCFLICSFVNYKNQCIYSKSDCRNWFISIIRVFWLWY